VREDGEARGHESVLDHICVTKDLEATVSVLSDTTLDHFPIVASALVNKVAATTKSIERRSFCCYMTNAKQRVVWDGQVSDVVNVEYGVRQGSLLGPVLYLLKDS
jgi:hypothetical protein